METRIDWPTAAPEGLQAMLRLAQHVRSTGLESSLLELVKLRTSQLNGCAYCIDMHTKDARAGGESEQRLYGVTAWREMPFFTDRERAALEWTEAVTRIGDDGVPDDLYDRTRRHFSEAELVELTLATVATNGFNRLAVAFRPRVGSYEPAAATESG